MPQVPLFPQDDGEIYHSEGEEKPQFVTPPVIVLDDRFDEQDLSDASEEKPKIKSPFSLRFLCFLGLIFCTIFGLGMLLLSIIATFISICYLFRNRSLNQAMLSNWKLASHTLVSGLGFVLGLISPTLGLGLIGLYFSITGQVMDDNVLHTFIKQTFNKF